MPLKYKDTTETIIGAAFEVRSAPGFAAVIAFIIGTVFCIQNTLTALTLWCNSETETKKLLRLSQYTVLVLLCVVTATFFQSTHFFYTFNY